MHTWHAQDIKCTNVLLMTGRLLLSIRTYICCMVKSHDIVSWSIIDQLHSKVWWSSYMILYILMIYYWSQYTVSVMVKSHDIFSWCISNHHINTIRFYTMARWLGPVIYPQDWILLAKLHDILHISWYKFYIFIIPYIMGYHEVFV